MLHRSARPVWWWVSDGLERRIHGDLQRPLQDRQQHPDLGGSGSEAETYLRKPHHLFDLLRGQVNQVHTSRLTNSFLPWAIRLLTNPTPLHPPTNHHSGHSDSIRLQVQLFCFLLDCIYLHCMSFIPAVCYFCFILAQLAQRTRTMN